MARTRSVGWFSVNVRDTLPVTSGPSFTSVTVTVTSREDVLKLSSRAWMLMRYWLLSRPDPWGDSKLGGVGEGK